MLDPRTSPSASSDLPLTRAGGVQLSDGAEGRLTESLRAAGITVEPFRIDVADYSAYFEAAEYVSRHPHYYPGNIREKSLEHYIAARLLSIGPDDRYIDIASEHSPVPEIYHRLFGCQTLRQDLSFPPGLHGDTIGSDAANMPVPDEYASAMGLHCSFEHFEGEADRRFVAEARRVLRPGGRLCIVPFYLAEEYSIQTDPAVALREVVPFESDAIVHYAAGWGNRFGRFYDVEHVLARVIGPSTALTATVYRLIDVQAVDTSCYARFALLFAKPRQ
jgi:SAM-dependent methyltransferase